MATKYTADTTEKVIGLNLAIKQGDVQANVYVPGVNADAYGDFKTAIEATQEFSVIGYSIVVREKTYEDGTMTITGGSDTVKCATSQINLKRTATVGEDEVDMKALYIKMKFPQDQTKAEAFGNALLGKTIGGAKVTAVFNGSSQIVASAS